MISLEMFLVAGFGFLFAGLGALTTFALLEFQAIEHNFMFNLLVFLTSSIAWWFVLWYPIKLLKRDRKPYHDLVGSVVELSNDIRKEHVSSIVWSGVRMRAALDEEEQTSILKKGTKARITRIKGNVLYLIKEE